jgi:hypothetical protein
MSALLLAIEAGEPPAGCIGIVESDHRTRDS